MVDLTELVAQLGTMGGVASLIAVLVNVLKQVGLVKDGDAKTWASGLNLAALVALYVLRIVQPQFGLEQTDALASSVAQVVTVILQFVVMLGISVGANGVVKSLPIVGYSNTEAAEKEIRKNFRQAVG